MGVSPQPLSCDSCGLRKIIQSNSNTQRTTTSIQESNKRVPRLPHLDDSWDLKMRQQKRLTTTREEFVGVTWSAPSLVESSEDAMTISETPSRSSKEIRWSVTITRQRNRETEREEERWPVTCTATPQSDGEGEGEERDHTPVAMYGLRLVAGVCFLPKRNNNKMKRVRSFLYFFSSVSSQPSIAAARGDGYHINIRRSFWNTHVSTHVRSNACDSLNSNGWIPVARWRAECYGFGRYYYYYYYLLDDVHLL